MMATMAMIKLMMRQMSQMMKRRVRQTAIGTGAQNDRPVHAKQPHASTCEPLE